MTNDEKIENESVISTTEDKVRLTLKEQHEANGSSSKSLTFLGFSLSFGIPLFTAEFKDFGLLKASLLQSCFIIATVAFFLVFLIESVKTVLIKRTGKGSDDWFISSIQGEKYQKEKNESFIDKLPYIDFKEVLGLILHILLYLLPIGLWILVISLVGWPVAWDRTIIDNELPHWCVTLFLSLMWYGFTYYCLIGLKGEIDEWFYENF